MKRNIIFAITAMAVMSMISGCSQIDDADPGASQSTSTMIAATVTKESVTESDSSETGTSVESVSETVNETSDVSTVAASEETSIISSAISGSDTDSAVMSVTESSIAETTVKSDRLVERIDIHETGGIDGRDLEYNIYRDNDENILVFMDHDGRQESGTYHISDKDMEKLLSVDYEPYLNASRDNDLMICDAVYTDIDFCFEDGSIVTVYSYMPELYDMLYDIKDKYEPVQPDKNLFPLSGKIGEYEYKITNEMEHAGTTEKGYYMDMEKRPDSPLFVYINSGEHNTGGYDIYVTDIQIDGDMIIITVNDTAPAPDSIVTEAFTYPCCMIELYPRPDSDKIIIQDINGVIYNSVDTIDFH